MRSTSYVRNRIAGQLVRGDVFGSLWALLRLLRKLNIRSVYSAQEVLTVKDGIVRIVERDK